MGATTNRLAGLTPPPGKAGGCKVGRLRDSLTGEERYTLDDILASNEWQHVAIAEALDKGLDVTISAKTIGTHRNGRCSCRS